ncbi:MAG: DNA-directed RNA polymerase subunit delta [Desulfosporosinus sp.]
MTRSITRKHKLTEADIAYEVLKAHGQPMHYKTLIEEVLRRLDISPEAVRIAAALTQINLDARFSYLGRGEWGLRMWEPTKISKRLTPVTLMNKASTNEKEKLDPEKFDEDILDEDMLDEEALDEEALDEEALDEEALDEEVVTDDTFDKTEESQTKW